MSISQLLGRSELKAVVHFQVNMPMSRPVPSSLRQKRVCSLSWWSRFESGQCSRSKYFRFLMSIATPTFVLQPGLLPSHVFGALRTCQPSWPQATAERFPLRLLSVLLLLNSQLAPSSGFDGLGRAALTKKHYSAMGCNRQQLE